MSEFRQDITSGEWVIIAPGRGRRPRPPRRQTAPPARAAFEPGCPFCPGNEHLLASLLEETPRETPPGWSVRVVVNKYPALDANAAPSGCASPAGARHAGQGHHEVIIETPEHDGDLTTLGAAGLRDVVAAYQRRWRVLAADPAVRSVVVFRNHGPGGGASLAHPHAQAIASSLVPPRLAAVSAIAGAHHAATGRCLACEHIGAELADGRRLVEVTERFVTMVPFAASTPCEQRIWPRRHRAAFADCYRDELAEFAGVLQRALARLAAALDDPPYSFAIEAGAPERTETAWGHWALRLVPRITTAGGYELGSGMAINPSLPENDAALLRDTDPGGQAG